MRKIRGYIFKKRIMWIGCIISKCDNATPLFADDVTVPVYPEMNVEYVCFSLTQKKALKKIERKSSKMIKDGLFELKYVEV